LKIPYPELLERLDSQEIATYIAYDLTQDEDFAARIQKEAEIEASRELSSEDYAAQFKKLLGG